MLEQDTEKLGQKVIHQLSIDNDRLLEELKNQASLFFYWSYLADISEEVAVQLKAAVSQLEAEVAGIFRTENLKITDSKIQEHLNTHPKVIEGRTRLNKARLIANIHTSARYAFAQRGRMLLAMRPSRGEVAENFITD